MHSLPLPSLARPCECVLVWGGSGRSEGGAGQAGVGARVSESRMRGWGEEWKGGEGVPGQM